MRLSLQVNAFLDKVPKFSDISIPSLGISTPNMTAEETAGLLTVVLPAFLHEPLLEALVRPAAGKLHILPPFKYRNHC